VVTLPKVQFCEELESRPVVSEVYYVLEVGTGQRSLPCLTLRAMALFFDVMSLPQVTLNLVAQVTQDLAVRPRTILPSPPPKLLQGP
jgi:hypothetical protein